MSNQEQPSPRVLEDGNPSSYPLPVPKHMRTQKLFSRTLALGFTLVWFLTMALGTQALSRSIENSKSPFDDFLVEGKTYWIASVSENSNKCFGYLKSDFTPPIIQGTEHEKNVMKTPELKAFGVFMTRAMGNTFETIITLDAAFSKYLSLSKGSINVRAEHAEIHLETSAPGAPIELSLNNGAQELTHSISLGGAVYLKQRTTKAYSLQFPINLGSSVLQHGQKLPNTGHLKPVKLEQFELCKASLFESKSLSREQYYDVSSMLQLLPIKNMQQLLSSFSTARRTAETPGSNL